MRRQVRTTTQFWAALDSAMPAGQEPSWHDFAATDLPDVDEHLAQDWDHLPPLIPGRGYYRIPIGTGRIAAFHAIQARPAGDGSIELIGVEIDLGDTTPEDTD